MKISIIFLLLAGVAATLAFPERPARRFFPRRKQNEVTSPLEEEPEKEAAEEPVTPRFRIGGVPRKNLAPKKEEDAPAEQPSGPRFRIAGRPSSSSFTPRKSSAAKQAAEEPSFAGRPLEAVANIPSARPAPFKPAAPEQASAAAPRAPAAAPRRRGSTTFIESLKLGTIPVEPSQIEELEKLQAAGGRTSSRVPSRAPAVSSRPVSRVSSRRSFMKPSAAAPAPSPAPSPAPAPAPAPAPVEETPVAPAKASPPQTSGSDKESRRQRLLQLNRRPRIGGANAEAAPQEPKITEEELAREMPEKVLAPEKDQLSDNQITDVAKEKPSEQDSPKLDNMEEKAIDKTLKEEAAEKQKEKPSKQTVPKVETPSQVTSEDAPPALDAEDIPIADTADPETLSTPTTTTEAPKRRGTTTLKRLRNSRPSSSSEPRTRGESSGGQQRTRDPSPSPAGDATTPVRTSSRRGGRGNSRGGAAVAAAAAERTASVRAGSARTASTRASSPRTRGPSSRGRSSTPVEAALEATEEESARNSKPLIRRRRQFQSLSARLARRARPVIVSSKSSTQEASQNPEEKNTGPSNLDVSEASEIDQPIPTRLTPRRVAGGRPARKNNQLSASDRKTRRKHSRTLVQRLRDRQRLPVGGKSESDVESENTVSANESSPRPERLGSDVVDQSKSEGTGTVERPGRPKGRFRSSQQKNKPDAQKDVKQQTEDNLKPLSAAKPRETRVRGARLSTLRPNVRRRFKTRLLKTKSDLSDGTSDAKTSTIGAESPTTTTEVSVTTTSLMATEGTTTTTPLTTEQSTTPTTTSTPTTTASLSSESFTLESDLTSSTEASRPISPSTSSTTISVTPKPPKLVRNRLRRIQTRTRVSTEAALETREKVRARSEATSAGTTTTTTPLTTTSSSATTPSTTTITTTSSTTTSTTITKPSTTTSTTTTPSSTTTVRATTPSTTTTVEKWIPKVAPEDPQNAVNRGGFRFRLHEDSEREITRHRGEVVLTEVGRLEDTPRAEVNRILAGLGGRRRGLGRPLAGRSNPLTTTTTTTTQSPALGEADYYDDYYYDEV